MKRVGLYLLHIAEQYVRLVAAALFLCTGTVVAGQFTSNLYGKVVSQHKNYIKDATVEKVVLYSQHNDASAEVIERDALLVRYDNAEGTIVVCHGFMCDKTDVGILRQIFGPGRFNILSFDFRAHGKKVAGQCCTFGRDEANEVRAAAHFVKSHPALKDKPLFLYGFSMGAVAGIEAQSKDPSLFSAMILDCPFSSSAEVVSRGLDTMLFSVLGYKFKMPGRSLLQQYLFHPYVQSLVQVTLKTVAGMNPKNININICSISPKESVKKISVPAFFILCKQDERVSVDAIKSLYNNVASNYKELWLTNGRFHFDSLFHNPERYKDKVQSFLDKAVTGKLAATKEQTITEDDEDELL